MDPSNRYRLFSKPNAGDNFAVIQMLVHNPLGTLAYPWPVHWAVHTNIAYAAYERLSAIHARIAEIAPSEDKMRTVWDEELLVEAYDCGTSMVSNAVRSVRHLAQAMTAQNTPPLTSTRVIDQIREATAAVEIDGRAGHGGYNCLGDIVRVRDAIEHPTASNVYQGDGGTWDQVPLPWLLSDQSLKAYVGYREWIDLISGDWEALLASREGEIKLTVTRGMRSKHPAKKPRSGR